LGSHARVLAGHPRDPGDGIVEVPVTGQVAEAGEGGIGALLPDLRGEVAGQGEEHQALVGSVIVEDHMRHLDGVGAGARPC